MNIIFPIAIAFALAAVVVVLGLGILNLLQARRAVTPDAEIERAKRSNKLMQWRVILQGVALAILFLAFLVTKH